MTTEPATLIASLQFFVRLHLPAKVRTSEKIPLKIQIFYYGDDDDGGEDSNDGNAGDPDVNGQSCVDVELRLRPSKGFDFVEKGDAAGIARRLCACEGVAVTEVMTISPKQIGDVEVVVEAKTMAIGRGRSKCGKDARLSDKLFADVVKKKMRVDAEGFQQVMTINEYYMGYK